MVTTSALGGAEACSGKAFAFFFFYFGGGGSWAAGILMSDEALLGRKSGEVYSRHGIA
jgi:hypothetical protein